MSELTKEKILKIFHQGSNIENKIIHYYQKTPERSNRHKFFDFLKRRWRGIFQRHEVIRHCPNRIVVNETNQLFKKNNIWVTVVIENVKYNLFIDLSNGKLYNPDKTNVFKVSKVNIWEEDGNEHMKFDNLEVLKVGKV